MSFKQVDPKQSFPELEKEILEFWEKNKIFEKSIEKNRGKKKFVFFEGPPTANGRPGIHHVIGRSYKDIIPRYKTMKGFFVARRAGWDTHGLPVEIQVEKELNISGKKEIEDYGIANFNEKCKESVWKYKSEWEDLTKRVGFWIDLKHPYITYDNSYIEEVWGLLKQIYEKGLLYQDFKVVPYCPRCGTPLSSHEVAQGYRKVNETSVYIKFKLKNYADTYILSWTTTPWTLPGNVALAINPSIKYVRIKIAEKSRVKPPISGEEYILAKDRLSFLAYDYEIVEEYEGKDIVGWEYEQLFDVKELKSDKSFKIYPADFVTTEDGTGVVHTAVMYGEEDYELGKKVGLPKFHTVDTTGHFIQSVPEVGGIYVKAWDVDEKIIGYLKGKNRLFSIQKYEHEYPFCWRCDSALIYYAKTSWFIAMTKVRDQLLANNETINWIPAYIKKGRFGEWLVDVKDWALSRERYWGTPLPVWECSCGEKIFIGSIDELKERSSEKFSEIDLHRPFIDEIKIKCPVCQKEASRVKDLIDVWFDSGSMPFASREYPDSFPADYICEAIDQTRGWFYTLLAISTLLDKGTPYKNVICYSHVLDEHGKKMSKSKGNVLDPWMILDKYGADATRWFFYTVNAPGDPKRMGERDVQESLRKFILILWNVYSFFTTYANLDGWTVKKNKKSDKVLDRWITEYLNQVILNTGLKLDKLDLVGAAREIEHFTTDLSTWYLRNTRKRRDDEFYSTLYYVLSNLTVLIAPFVPFISEKIYGDLVGVEESVHLASWPEVEKPSDELIGKMEKVRVLVEKGRALRAEKGIRTRQPLASFTVNQELEPEFEQILKDELNVYNVKVGKSIGLDTAITPELKQEGTKRDIVRLIQDLRKKANLQPGDKAKVYFEGEPELEAIVQKNLDQIENDTNVSLIFNKKDLTYQGDFKAGDQGIWLGLEK